MWARGVRGRLGGLRDDVEERLQVGRDALPPVLHLEHERHALPERVAVVRAARRRGERLVALRDEVDDHELRDLRLAGRAGRQRAVEVAQLRLGRERHDVPVLVLIRDRDVDPRDVVERLDLRGELRPARRRVERDAPHEPVGRLDEFDLDVRGRHGVAREIRCACTGERGLMRSRGKANCIQTPQLRCI